MNGKIITGKVLVKEIKPEEKTAGGIIRPATEPKNQMAGEVKATGAGTEVSVGEKVIFSRYAGVKFEIQGQEHIVLNERDVLYRY